MNSITSIVVAGLMMTGTMLVHAAPVNQSALAATQLSSVKNALHAKDDSKVMLKGKLIRALGDEKYQFQDASGTITVEIDDELWQGHAVSEQQEITLLGEVDIDYKPTKRVEVDVDSIQF